MNDIECNQLMIEMKDHQIKELMNQNQKIIKMNMDLNMELHLEKMKLKFLVERQSESMPRPNESSPRPIESMPRPTESSPRPIESMPRPNESISRPTESIPRPTESIPTQNESIPRPTESVQRPTDELTPTSTGKRIKHNLFLQEQLKIFPGRKKEFKSRNYSALYKRIRNKLKVGADKVLLIKKGKNYVQYNGRNNE